LVHVSHIANADILKKDQSVSFEFVTDARTGKLARRSCPGAVTGKGDSFQMCKRLDTVSITQRQIPQVLRKGRKRMFRRKKGGQPGNRNAVTHGRYAAPTPAELDAAAEEDRRHREWMKTMPKTDYAAICVAIEAHRRDQSRKESVR
jgi:hypothetical protein